MSYALLTPCYYCEKKEKCDDARKIQNAIYEIHNTNDGSHLGSGNIIISCLKQVSTLK